MPLDPPGDGTWRLDLLRDVLMVVSAPPTAADPVRPVVEAIARATGLEAVAVWPREGPGVAADGPRDAHGDGLAALRRAVAEDSLPPGAPYRLADGGLATGALDALPDLAPEPVERPPYRTLALLPMRSPDGVEGVLQLADSRADALDPEAIALLAGVATALGSTLYRSREEALLRARGELLRTAIDGVTDPIVFLDPAGVILVANREAASRMDHTLEEVEGGVARTLLPDSVAQELDGILSEVVATGTSVERVGLYDGWPAQVHMYPAYGPAGSIVGVAAVAHDATERRRAEEALRTRTAELDAFFELALDLLCIADMEGRFLRLNPQWERTLGYPLEELAGTRFLDLIHPDDLESTLAAVSTLSGQGEVHGFVNRYRQADGAYRWIEWRSAPQGATIYAAARDITDRLAVENELRESRSLLQAVLDASPVRLFWKDRGLRFLGANLPFARDAGFADPRELIGLDDTAMPWRAEAELYRADDREVMESGRPRLGYEEPQTVDGVEKWLRTSKVPLVSDEGDVAGLLVCYEDITLSKARERELRESEERFRNTFEQAAVGMAHVTLDGRYIRVNERFCQIVGRTREELVLLDRQSLTHPDDVAADDEAVSRMARGVTLRESLEKRYLRPDGSAVWVHLTSSIVRSSGGEPRYTVVVAEDISDRKQVEDERRLHALELERLNRELVRRNEELDEFSYIASHDLQEPLRKLVAFSELLEGDLGGDLTPNARKDVTVIREAALRMRQLVEDLLEFSRSGRGELRRQRVALDECADAALAVYAEALAELGAEVVRAPLPTVWGDRTLLTQLYQNLIGNSVRFRGAEPLRLELTASPDAKGWVLGVKDNGIGIDPSHHEQVFLPFKRLHGRQQYEGSGIGLAICRKAVERHGGSIWVESAPGAGAHFQFRLPERRGSA